MVEDWLIDPYRALGIEPTASDHEIRQQYRRLALEWHPDHNASPEAAERFRAITQAYATLCSPERRRAFEAARTQRGRPQGEPAKAGRAAMSWVEHFFVQAGGIEAEGPGKGALRRFTLADLEAIWREIGARLVERGEARQAIQHLALIRHYIARHPEIELPPDAIERIEEKQALLEELVLLRRAAPVAWEARPTTLNDLLRHERFEAARTLVLWHAARAQADRLAATGLFQSLPRTGAPVLALAMIDRLEAVHRGERPERRPSTGYLECRCCGGWAMSWGVGPPYCTICGSRRMRARPRDERDDWLLALVGRQPPRFDTQALRWQAALVQSLERWLWAPLFFLCALVAIALAPWVGWSIAAWAATLGGTAGWFATAWETPNVPLRDTEILYPEEWRVARVVARTLRWFMVAGLTTFGVAAWVTGHDGLGLYGFALTTLISLRPR